MRFMRAKWLFLVIALVFSSACLLLQQTFEIKITEVTQIVPVTQIVQATQIISIPQTAIVEIPVEVPEEVPPQIPPEVSATVIPPQFSPEGFLAYYPLDDDANDASGNQFHATVNGATFTDQGKQDGAYEFDGIDDDIKVLNIPYKPTGTISLWAFFEEGTRDAGIWSIGDENSDLMILGIRSYNNGSDRISFGALYQRQYYIISEGLPQIQTWHHFVGVWDEVTIYFYIDGVFQGTSINTSAKIIEDYERFNITRFGMFNYRDTGKFRGRIDEIKIYEWAFSAEEVLNLYRSYLE